MLFRLFREDPKPSETHGKPPIDFYGNRLMPCKKWFQWCSVIETPWDFVAGFHPSTNLRPTSPRWDHRLFWWCICRNKYTSFVLVWTLGICPLRQLDLWGFLLPPPLIRPISISRKEGPVVGEMAWKPEDLDACDCSSSDSLCDPRDTFHFSHYTPNT